MRHFVYTLERDPESLEGNPSRLVLRDALCAVAAACSGERGIRFAERSARDDPHPQILLQFLDAAAEDCFEGRIQLALEVRGLRTRRIEALMPEWKLELLPAPLADGQPSPEPPLPEAS